MWALHVTQQHSAAWRSQASGLEATRRPLHKCLRTRLECQHLTVFPYSGRQAGECPWCCLNSCGASHCEMVRAHRQAIVGSCSHTGNVTPTPSKLSKWADPAWSSVHSPSITRPAFSHWSLLFPNTGIPRTLVKESNASLEGPYHPDG